LAKIIALWKGRGRLRVYQVGADFPRGVRRSCAATISTSDELTVSPSSRWRGTVTRCHGSQSTHRMTSHAVSERYGQNDHTRGTRWTRLASGGMARLGRRNRERAVMAHLQATLANVTVGLGRLRTPPHRAVARPSSKIFLDGVLFDVRDGGSMSGRRSCIFSNHLFTRAPSKGQAMFPQGATTSGLAGVAQHGSFAASEDRTRARSAGSEYRRCSQRRGE
jgi:hypothetical protein